MLCIIALSRVNAKYGAVMQNILVGFGIQLFQTQPCSIKPVAKPDIAIPQCP